MPQSQISWNLDELDDPLIPDAVPSFEGGMFSNQRANLLQPNQSSLLVNCDIDKLGRTVTRRGTIQLGSGVAGVGTYIQGMANFQTVGYNYLVAANGKKLWAYDGISAWTQIAKGGVSDDDPITFGRLGQVNNSAGYPVGTTVIAVDSFTGAVVTGQSFIFTNSAMQDEFTYVIVAHHETGGNTDSITIAGPGLVTQVFDDWQLLVLQPAAVNHVGGYPGGATTMVIDGYVGIVNNGEIFNVTGENLTHTVTAHSETGGNTTSVTFTEPILGAYQALDPMVPIVITQGNDQLFWCDGIGNIYGWDGVHTTNLSLSNFLDRFTTDRATNGKPPVGPRTMVWFQSRLIVAGMANEPDTVYFSNFLDATTWNADFQSLRVGGGESDPIVALVPWADLNLIVLKGNSVYVINMDPSQNPVPSDPTQLVPSFAIKRIHGSIGCSSLFSATQVGGGGGGYFAASTGTWAPGSDVYFLDGQRKLRSVTRVLAAAEQQELGEPISFPVQDIFDRITAPYVNRCVSGLHNDRYMIALPIDGSTVPNVLMVYNLLTQSWSGKWIGWIPTYFSERTPVGDFLKFCIGQSDGTVIEWLDDVPEDQEEITTFQDNSVDYPTTIFTRALTGGDPFSPKTGLQCELEFSDSVADVDVAVFIDAMQQAQPLSPTFSSASVQPLILPFILPAVLPAQLPLLRKSFDLQRYGQYREMQMMVSASAGKLSMRSIRTTSFMDSIVLQTLP